MKAASVNASFALPIETSDGVFIACYSDQGLVTLGFPGKRRIATTLKPPRHIARWHGTAIRALIRLLAGREPGELPPLHFVRGTEFQKRVWLALQRIPRGSTSSYSELAKSIGSPKAARAVGSACGANPIPVFVPCHRVLAAGRKLGGFSGGLPWKKRLLNGEGVSI